MKKIDKDYWTHKGYDIYLLEHEKLYGKYEVYRNDEFRGRYPTFSVCKKIIDSQVEFLKKI
jgi:hypothetical protein